MALYFYTKKRGSIIRKIVFFLSVTCIISGFAILFWVLYPILSFEIIYGSRFDGLIEPIPNETIKHSFENELAQILGARNVDYTKASVWFPKAVNVKLSPANSSYTLSIPKLKIENAAVTVGGEDLSKSLIHFTGPLPGGNGNGVVFGHSTIPWLYNPKDYKTIFTKLPDLRNGDIILVSSDNVTYKYVISEMKVVSPDSLYVLEQNYDSPYITLVTCVPPGTFLKRLIVKGKLAAI